MDRIFQKKAIAYKKNATHTFVMAKEKHVKCNLMKKNVLYKIEKCLSLKKKNTLK